MIINEITFAIVAVLLFTFTVVVGVWLCADPFKEKTKNKLAKNIIIYVLSLIILFSASILPFHYVDLNGKIVVVAKKNLTLVNTVLYRADIYDAIDILSFYQDDVDYILISTYYPIDRLIDLELLDHSLEWTEKSFTKRYKRVKFNGRYL